MTHRFQKTLLVLLTLVLVGFSWLGRFELTADAEFATGIAGTLVVKVSVAELELLLA